MSSTNRFVLLSTQRSGSTWVVEMLNSHPRVAAYEEVLLPGQPVLRFGAGDMEPWHVHTRHSSTERRHSPSLRAYLDRLYAPDRHGMAVAGFKLMYSQAKRFPSVLHYLVAHRIPVVHLVRHNLFNAHLSCVRIRQTGIAHSRNGADAARVWLDTPRLLRGLRWRRAKVDIMRNLFRHVLHLPYLEVTYEDLASNRERFAEVLRFIGLPDPELPLNSSLRKLNASSHRDVIVNFGAVKRALAGTPFEWMLDDDANALSGECHAAGPA